MPVLCIHHARGARVLILLVAVLSAAMTVGADDWPEWRGRGRGGVWNETGILDRFPGQGLRVRWRKPVRAGFAGPAVAAGRVFVTDFARGDGSRGTERALALDERTGEILWTHEWPADYRGISYNSGPRATPTVDGDRVYTVGASGVLHCLDVRTGRVAWKKEYVADYGTRVPVWGITGAPLVDGDRLVCLVGGGDGATVVAFDKKTGRELWRAIPSDSEPGYGQPILLESGGTRQLVIWHPAAVFALDPATGAVLWQEPFKINMGMTVATPVAAGMRLLVSAFYNGSMMLGLEPGSEGRVLWRGKSSSEIKTDGLHALITTPVIDGDYVYGICSYGQLRCLDARTGERLWETMAVTREQARWAAAIIVRHRDRYFINNDRGELILARLSPKGYEEIDRTPLIRPTSSSGNRRELGAVHWSHPAYANGHIITRNDEEILSASLLIR